MKNIKLIALIVLFTNNSWGQTGSLIEYKFSSSKGATGNMTIKYSEFGSRSEMNMNMPQMPGGGMSMSTLYKKDNPDVVYMINDKTKTYSESKKSNSNGSAEDNGTYTVKKIGNETINGYKCVHAQVTNGNHVTDVWNTKDISDYNKYSEAMYSNKKMFSYKREQALKDAGCEGFPVKTVNKGNDREGDMTMELVKIEKKSFSKSDFEVPSTYTKSSSPAAGGVVPQMKSQQELINMTPEERAKYAEELKKQYGKGQ